MSSNSQDRAAQARGAKQAKVLSTIWPYLRSQTPSFGLLTVMLLVGVGLQLWGPLIVKGFIDEVETQGAAVSLQVLWTIAALFIGVTVAAQIVRLVGAYVSAQIGWTAANHLRRDILFKILRLDSSFHSRRSPGELIERSDGDVGAMVSVFSQFLFQILGSILLLAGILVVLAVKSLLIAAALAGFALCAAAAIQLTRGLGVERFTAERQVRSDISGFVEERVSGLDDIRANGGALHVLQRLNALSDRLTRRGMAAISRSAIYLVIVANGVFVVGYLIALALGLVLFERGTGTLGDIYLLMQYAMMMRAPLESIGTQVQELQRAMGSLVRIKELQEREPDVVDGPGVTWAGGPSALTLREVSFRYEGGEHEVLALHGINLHLVPGATLGVVGRTGSGKSTLVRLLSRFYDPTSGTIEIDGDDLRLAKLDQVRRHVGLVTQEVEILEASIRDNITLFDRSIGDVQLQEILMDLGLQDWIDRQPQGLDTKLAGDGGDLSSGEAQLLAFARVFVRRPGLVILDEASSRLDPATGRVAEAALDRLLSTARNNDGSPPTLIVVAHRLSTLRRVDQVLVLDKGEVVEFGDRLTLMADHTSQFARMLRTDSEGVLA